MTNNGMRFPFELYSTYGEGTLIGARYSRDKMELLEVTSGEVSVQIGTELILASAGDFLYVPPNMTFRVHSDSRSSVRGIIFDSSIIEENMLSYEAEILYMFFVQSENKIKQFSKDHPSYASISRSMNEAFDEYSAKDVCYKLVIRSNIYKIMTELLRHYCVARSDDDKSVYHNVLRLRPVIDFIAESTRERLTIEQLAEIIMVSPDYFTKMFKRSIGKTPIDYINAIRVNLSMQLLIDTNQSMPEIAEAVGFCNANYFHRIFKQYMDTSPLAYRKANKTV
ncbi:MAG: AraC family transcriptional regulator [Clostridia bacterium]|nr:AraC family transcriptional regulator [Clostridia bacterium]